MLRALTFADAPDYFAFASDEHVVRYLRWGPHASLAQTEAYLREVLEEYRDGSDGPWGIVEKRGGNLIGSIHLFDIASADRKAQVGVVLAKAYWNLGLATEALVAVLGCAFDTLSLHRVEGCPIADNIAAQRAMIKAGMRREGLLREYAYQKGAFQDIELYAILGQDYRASRA